MFYLLTRWGAFPDAACPRAGLDWSSFPAWPPAVGRLEAVPARLAAAFHPEAAFLRPSEAARLGPALRQEAAFHQEAAQRRQEAASAAAAVAWAAGTADRAAPS